MFNQLLKKRILSGAICLATVAGSIGASVSCGKKDESKDEAKKEDAVSFKVSCSENNNFYKFTGANTIAKSTEYKCDIKVETSKCNFMIDEIIVTVGGNNVWSKIKEKNPKELPADGVYKLIIPAEQVTGDIKIDLSKACQEIKEEPKE